MSRTLWKRILFAPAMLLIAIGAFGSWALASPVGSSPDEDFHLASIWCGLGEREGLCEPAGLPNERIVQSRLVNSSSCFAFKNEKSAACDLSDVEYGTTSRGNFEAQYPPIFYGTMGLFASEDIAVSTVIMRLFNSALFIGVIAALFALLRAGQRGPLYWGTVAAIVPLGMFIVPSVNPSSWAVLAGATLWISLVGYFTAESTRSRVLLGVLSGVLAVLGAGARGDSASYVALSAVLAAVLTFEAKKSWVVRAILPAGVTLMGGFFFLTSAQTGSALTQGAESPPLTVGSAVQSLFLNLPKLPSLWVGNLGTWGLGWLDTTMPPAVWVTMIAVFSGLAFWGLRAIGPRKLLALAIITAAMIVVPMYVVVRDQIEVGSYLQPRYLLPMMFMFIGVVLYGFRRDDLGLSRLQVIVVLIGVIGANSVALYTNMRRYITGFDYSGFSLDSNVEWWWSSAVSPMTVWVIGSLSFALLLFGCYRMMSNSSGTASATLSKVPTGS